jgi:hypothetical protein
MKLLFLSSMPRKPAGGVRVIYNYVKDLRRLGIDAYVLHPLKNYIYKFADEQTPVYTLNEISDVDHLVIPDVYIGQANAANLNGHRNYSLFIQNPYIIRTIQKYNNKELINTVFNNAKFILCISEDTETMILEMYPHVQGKLIRTGWALPGESKLRFDVASKEKLISYMPRKNIDHIQLTLDCIGNKLPSDWKLVPIVRMSRHELESTLNKSSIYLSFGSFEGLPAPPVEAAISGNYVIGYHGNGGREYWNKPNFTEINVCDIRHFSTCILERVRRIDANPAISSELENGINDLMRRFSASRQLDCVRGFAEVVFANKAGLQHDKKRRTPFVTDFISHNIDRLAIKFKQISHGL